MAYPITIHSFGRALEYWRNVYQLLFSIITFNLGDQGCVDIKQSAFDGLLKDALRRFPPNPDSGLVVMQKHFMRFARMSRPKTGASR